MRTLDVAAGASVSIISLLLLSAMNPGLLREQSAEISERSRTRAAILGFIQTVGMPWLASSTLREICDSLAHYNSSFTLNARRDEVQCTSMGGTHYAYSSVFLSLGGSELGLEAWEGFTRR